MTPAARLNIRSVLTTTKYGLWQDVQQRACPPRTCSKTGTSRRRWPLPCVPVSDFHQHQRRCSRPQRSSALAARSVSTGTICGAPPKSANNKDPGSGSCTCEATSAEVPTSFSTAQSKSCTRAECNTGANWYGVLTMRSLSSRPSCLLPAWSKAACRIGC